MMRAGEGEMGRAGDAESRESEPAAETPKPAGPQQGELFAEVE